MEKALHRRPQAGFMYWPVTTEGGTVMARLLNYRAGGGLSGRARLRRRNDPCAERLRNVVKHCRWGKLDSLRIYLQRWKQGDFE